MAKLNIEVNVVGSSDVKTLEKALKQLESSSVKVDRQNKTSGNSFKSMAIKIAAATAAIYTLQKAIRLMTSTGFEYNNSIEQSKQGLIALSVAAQDKAIPVIDRYKNAMNEANYTMAELQKINAETPHTLDQTNKIYKAMYISMRSVGATTEEMITLTKKLSIASGAAGIDFNALLAGVDGLASGTVLANSDLGRFLKGLGLTNEKLKESKDVVGLVTKALEDFEAADTMAVAVSNATNSWNIFAGAVNKPLFDGVKKALNEVSKMMNKVGPESTQIFADAMVDFANGGIKAVGFVIKAVNQLIGLLETSYAGYMKLYGWARGGDVSEAEKELEELKRKRKEKDYDWIGSGSSDGSLRRAIKNKEEEIEKIKEANALRREGDQIQEKAIKRTEEINKIITAGVEKIKIEYGKVEETVDKLSKPLETVFKPVAPVIDKKSEKAAKKKKKEQERERERLMKDYEREAERLRDMFSSVGDGLLGSISGALGPIASEINNFYGDVQALMAQASAASQAQSAAEGSAATGPAVAKAGSQAGLYGAIAMAGLLSVFGMVSSGGLSDFFGGGEAEPPELETLSKTSDSIANSLEHLEEAQYPMLQMTRDMRNYLKLISNSFGNIENSLLRSDIDFAGNFYEEQTKSGAGGLSTKDYTLFGTTLDFGAATIAELMAEQISVERDTIIKKVYDSFWKTKTTYFHNYEDVSNLFAEDIADATKALFSGFDAISKEIGININGMMDEVIDIGKIDTTGKTSSEIAAEIEARFSAQTDAIAEKYLGVVSEFQRAGEGLAETAFRVAMTFDQVSHSMELIGKTVDWRTANIIEETSGGIDMLNTNLGNYMDNFFSEQEQYEMQLNTMTKSFNSLGLSIPDSKEQFRALVDGIDTTTDSGARLFSEVISLSGGFAEMIDAAEGLNGSVSGVTRTMSETSKKVADAWLGNLSYLDLRQKADYATGYFELSRRIEGIGTADSARAMAETALKTSATRADYIPVFEKYVRALENEETDATNRDLLEELQALKEEVIKLKEAQTDASIYGGAIA